MEKEREGPPSKLNRLLGFLSCHFQRYPFDETKDSKYFNMLIEEFVELDIEDQLRQYHAWTLDQPDDKKIYYRSRFRSWLKRALDYKTARPLSGYWQGGHHRAQSRW